MTPYAFGRHVEGVLYTGTELPEPKLAPYVCRLIPLIGKLLAELRIANAMSQSARLQTPLLIGFVLLLAIAASSVWLYFAANQLNTEVSRSLQARSVANRLLILTQDAETGQRGFLLTHNREYLEPYRAGTAEIPQMLANLTGDVALNSTEIAIVARLRDLVDAKLREVASTLFGWALQREQRINSRP